MVFFEQKQERKPITHFYLLFSKKLIKNRVKTPCLSLKPNKRKLAINNPQNHFKNCLKRQFWQFLTNLKLNNIEFSIQSKENRAARFAPKRPFLGGGLGRRLKNK